MTFLQTLRWKREYKSDREKFDLPYSYTLNDGDVLSIEQRRFTHEGFASTVWDSSIVLSKFLERRRETVAGRRCLDLSAGCGLVASVVSHLAPECVVATDLPQNLPLLRKNVEKNGAASVRVVTVPYVWGAPLTEDLATGFDVVFACDVLYDVRLVPALVTSLERLLAAKATAFVCHGRNAHAEESFLTQCASHFVVSRLDWAAFDPLHRSEDIECLILKRI